MSSVPAAASATPALSPPADSTRNDKTFRHAWAPGDVVMWDNGCVLHREMVAGY